MIQLLLMLSDKRSLLQLSYLCLLLTLPAVAMPSATIQKRESAPDAKVSQETLASTRLAAVVIAGQQETTPEITLDTAYIRAFELGLSVTEELQFYTVTFSNMPPGEPAYITLNDQTGTFSISMDGGNTYSDSLVIAPIGNTHQATGLDVSVTVRFLRNEEAPHVTASITHSTAGTEPSTLALEGAVLIPLPLRLLSFDARLQQHSVIVKWKAAADSDLLHFELETATGQPDDFKKVGVISYAGKEDEYQYTFNPESTGGVHYFRLAQTYYNHPTLYSNIIAVKTTPVTSTRVMVLPNPLQASSRLHVITASAGQLKMVLYNSGGKALFHDIYTLNGGENYVDLPPVQHLAQGLYLITTELNGEISRLKVLKH